MDYDTPAHSHPFGEPHASHHPLVVPTVGDGYVSLTFMQASCSPIGTRPLERPAHTALFLENAERFEVEIVTS